MNKDSLVRLTLPVMANRAGWLLRFLPAHRGWKISSLGDGTYEIRYASYRMRMNREYALNTFNEDGILRGLYLPGHSIAERVVLDVGAGCGETAALFLAAGAKSVVCIEPNKAAFGFLVENIEKNNWENQVSPIEEPFRVSHLDIPHDYLKMDCEGGESELLKANGIREGVVVLHPGIIGAAVASQIADRLGLTRGDSEAFGGEELWVKSGDAAGPSALPRQPEASGASPTRHD